MIAVLDLTRCHGTLHSYQSATVEYEHLLHVGLTCKRCARDHHHPFEAVPAVPGAFFATVPSLPNEIEQRSACPYNVSTFILGSTKPIPRRAPYMRIDAAAMHVLDALQLHTYLST